MSKLVIYCTPINNIPYWKTFKTKNELQQFINALKKSAALVGLEPQYEVYTLVNGKALATAKNVEHQDSDSTNVNKAISDFFNEEKKLEKKPEVKMSAAEEKTVEKPEEKIEELPKENSQTLPYKSEATLDHVIRKSKKGNFYKISEGYGKLDEQTNTTGNFNIEYAFGMLAETRPSYIKANSNKEAINRAIGIIKASKSVRLSVYNVDKNGQNSNLLYYYLFEGVTNG